MAESPKKLRLLGRSVLETLAGRAQTCLDAWCTDWICGAGIGERPPLQVSEVSVKSRVRVAGHAWRAYGSPVEHVAIGLPDHADPGLMLAMFGAGFAPSTPVSHLQHDLQEMALTDLAQRLLGDDHAARYASELEHDDLDVRTGGVIGLIRIGDADMKLFFSPALVQRMAPARPRSVSTLETRRVAIMAEPLEVAANLDLGHIRLGDLLNLKPGDMLVTQTPLDTSIVLMIGVGGVSASTGHLGSSQGRRALLITQTHPFQRTQVHSA